MRLVLMQVHPLLFYTVSAFVLSGLLFIALEVVFRMKGLKPWRPNAEKAVIEPEGLFYKSHPRLGFTHREGAFHLKINDRFDFTAHHNCQGFRITRDQNGIGTERLAQKTAVWIFGCSYTYGWLVNDEETYPWLLQERLEEYAVENYAVVGYGTVQSFLLFRELLTGGPKPSIVVLAYARFHDSRNTFPRSKKKSWARIDRTSGLAIVSVRSDKNGGFVYRSDRLAYRGIPLSKHSAFLNFVDNSYNSLHDRQLRSTEIAEAMILEFNRLCAQNQITFIVAGIREDEGTKKMLSFCNDKRIRAVDIAAPRGPENPQNTFYPHDDHPSPLAHRQYAEKLYKYIDGLKNSGGSRADFIDA